MHFAVPSEKLISVAYIQPGDDVEAIGQEHREMASEYEALCLVAYDGDSGERMSWPVMPSLLA